jgi:ribose 5-phosphate isomerase B
MSASNGSAMKLSIGADHAGYEMKRQLVEFVEKLGHTVHDVGTFEPDKPDDYPDYAILVAEDIRSGQAERGILVCGSGVGVSVAANKFKGIRAGLCHDHYSAHQGVEHDDMNVLVLGSRIIGPMLAQDAVEAFLKATFSGEARHVRRLNKVKGIEKNEFR